MRYFLIVYRRSDGQLRSLKEFASGEGEAAMSERSVLELEHKDEPDVEVVVLGASSLESLKNTHSRYFKELTLDSLDSKKAEEFKRLTEAVSESKVS